MPCNHCGVKFNFLHKEMGCSNCGQSFCGKCLREKCKIPSKDDKNLSVCRTCYIKLTSPADSTNAADQHVMAPDVFFKRMENLDKPKSQSPITVYGQDLINREQFLCAGLSQADIQLEKRLQKLKDHGGEIKTLPTDSEIRARLSKLKGENSYTKEPTKGKLLYPADSRSDSERVDSLLEQYVTEKDIELSKNDGAVEEIEARLATLREQGVRPNEGPYVRQLHDDLPEEGTDSEEQEVDKLTRKIMDEVAMDSRNPLERRAKSKEEADEDSTDERDEWEDEVEEKVRKDSPELPWCVLCNNDATYRCLDCAGDLYCDECNREVHQNWGENGHKVVRYRRT